MALNLLEALDELARYERDLKAAASLVRRWMEAQEDRTRAGYGCRGDCGSVVGAGCLARDTVAFTDTHDESGRSKVAPADGGHAALVELSKSLIIGLEDATETIHARCCTDAGCVDEHREAAAVLDVAKPKAWATALPPSGMPNQCDG